MSEKPFIEVWSLGFDDLAWVEAVNRPSRVWAAFQLLFFRRHGRFPSRDADTDGESVRYLGSALAECQMRP